MPSPNVRRRSANQDTAAPVKSSHAELAGVLRLRPDIKLAGDHEGHEFNLVANADLAVPGLNNLAAAGSCLCRHFLEGARSPSVAAEPR